MQIAQDIFLISGVNPNVYVVSAPTGLTMIDCGLPFQARKILAALAELGYPERRLERIIITHADFDHIGSLTAVVSATGAVVAASPIEAQAIQTGQPSRYIRSNGFMQAVERMLTSIARPARVEVLLSDGEVQPLLGGLQVIYTPGHTPGHISLWCPTRRVLFAGDSLSVHDGRVRENRHFVWDPALISTSYRKQAALRPLLVCGGHGWTDHGIEQDFIDREYGRT